MGLVETYNTCRAGHVNAFQSNARILYLPFFKLRQGSAAGQFEGF